MRARLGGTITTTLSAGAVRKLAFVGNHLPRQCGIATFTSDLADAIISGFPEIECFVLAMNDGGQRYDYPPRVRFEITEGDLGSYRRAADYLNVNSVDAVCVQHEYGIFGGKAGSHVLALLRELRMPIVTTLHTILAEPNTQQRQVMEELTQLSERIVVMSDHGAELLTSVHHVDPGKIDRIPHGIRELPFATGSKDHLGVEGKKVILTFGLLSPDKGIENVIDALPAILARHPDAIYIVLGATHPHVKARFGETYRLMLEARAHRLGVSSSIIFHDRFVGDQELAEFLSAADVYVTPYLKPEQITSGTLAYAVGSGKAVVSTPYWYARELLADDHGVLVPWADPGAIARAVSELLGDDAKRLALRERAFARGRNMVWPAVARRYAETFARARTERTERLRSTFQTKTLATRAPELPAVDLAHVFAMTDDTGILQHASFSVPRYDDGYCLDDNARALLLMAHLEDAGIEEPRSIRPLASRYMAFVNHSFNPRLGRFRNFMTYSRRWTEEAGSEDSHGRALWALGSVVGRSGDPGRQSLAGTLFHASLGAVTRFTSPRAWAFALLGIDEYLRAFQGDSVVESTGVELARKLLARFHASAGPDWPWFEDRLTYCNARLSQALLATGARMRDEDMVAVAIRSLEWLVVLQTCKEGYFAPIGSNGFYVRGGPRAEFDQQPVEAGGVVSACLLARRITGSARWSEGALRAFHWFLGQNQRQTFVYDVTTGGCRDGLHVDRVNENEGAEATLSFLLALAEIRAADRLEVHS